MTRDLFITCLLAGSLAGCSRDLAPSRITGANAPDSRTATEADLIGGMPVGRLPLAYGDRWTYQKRDRTFSINDGDTTIVFDSHGTVVVTDNCPDSFGGHAYLFQTSLEKMFIGNISTSLTTWVDLREDPKGLYGYYPPASAIPDCAPPEALADEVPLPRAPGPGASEGQLLAFPLHPGQSWTYAEPATGHIFDARVTGLGSCTVPAGTWRAIQVTSVWRDGGPGYRDDAWYGNVGLLRTHHHQEGPNVIFESEMVLTAVDLVDARP